MAMDGPINFNGGGGGGGVTTVEYFSGGGGGGGGGYTVKSPVTPADEINAQLTNAGNIYNNEAALAKKGADKALENIANQRKANAQQFLMKNNQLSRNSDWQPNQQKEQSTLNNLRRTMGNAAYGSGMVDLQEGLSRYDDMADVQLINTWKENQDEAYNSWYQANADLINDYNEQIIRAQNTLDTAWNNYLQNIAGVDARLGNEAYKSGNWGKEISRKEDDQTYKTTMLTKDPTDYFKKWLTNEATANNPNIPDTNGIVDYIRPNNAVAEARNRDLGNVGKVNTSAGAFAPTKVNSKINPIGRRVIQKLAFPGYNYQRENFASYNPRS